MKSARAGFSDSVQWCYDRRLKSELALAWLSIFGSGLGALIVLVVAIQQKVVPAVYPTMFVVLFLLTGFGVSGGYHRYFCHQSFQTSRVGKILLAVLAIWTAEGCFFRWIHDHRVHHRYADQPGDPHSPYFCGAQPLSGFAGFLHAHCVWLLRPRIPFDARVIADLARDRDLVRLDAWSLPIAISGVLLPGVIAMSVEGASLAVFVTGVLWGGLLRMAVLNHIVWGVNSIGHLFGSRVPGERNTDQARNNAVLGVLAFGDGWHANHHADPRSARHGLKWWEVDVTYWVLALFATMGFVSALQGSRRG